MLENLKIQKNYKVCEIVCAGCHRKLERGYQLIKIDDILNNISKLV